MVGWQLKRWPNSDQIPFSCCLYPSTQQLQILHWLLFTLLPMGLDSFPNFRLLLFSFGFIYLHSPFYYYTPLFFFYLSNIFILVVYISLFRTEHSYLIFTRLLPCLLDNPLYFYSLNSVTMLQVSWRLN